MDTDVYVIYTRRLSQVLLKVLHVSDEELLFACEVFVYLSVFVENMNHNYLLLLLHLHVSRGPRTWRFLETVVNAALTTNRGCLATERLRIYRASPESLHSTGLLLLKVLGVHIELL